jgi:3-isopropylmalate dehydrogenase
MNTAVPARPGPLRLGVLPGDGIGPEIVPASVAVADAAVVVEISA